MKRQLLAIMLALGFVLAPLCIFAQGADVRTQFAEGSFEYADSLYENNAISESARLTFRYAQKEQKTPQKPLEIGCKAAYIADTVTGKVFFEKNAHQKMYPASTTKILTALVTLESCDADEQVTISEKAAALVEEGYSNAYLQAGETLSVYTLLQAMLIPSANEAAYALAEHISGNISDFAALCNQRAKQLGCETLHFVNPNGLHDKDHYCSAYDLFLVTKACQKYDVFNEIVKTKEFTVPATKIYPQEDRLCRNTNELLLEGDDYYAYCTGVKTGHTTPAGECLVASADNDDIHLISVVLGGTVTDAGNERFLDTRKLFDYVYDNFSFERIADKSVPLRQVSVKHAVSDQEELELVIQTDIYGIVPGDIAPGSIRAKIELAQEIKAPIRKNQVLGTAQYQVDGITYTTNIVASHDVAKKPFWLYNSLVVLGVILVLYLVLKIRQIKIKAARKAARKARRERLARENQNRRDMQ